MTSKLRRTLVGMGIALGGAAPGCFGNSARDDDVGSDDGTFDAGEPDAGSPDASLDASSDTLGDAADPFCDVSWPPTKANPTPGTVACVDPLGECAEAWPPTRCHRVIEPATCVMDDDRLGPLYCVNGQWECPPGSSNGTTCQCWQLSPERNTCADAGAN